MKKARKEETATVQRPVGPRKNRKPRSAYDTLHDRYLPIRTSKAGTRYERLAAMVWKILNEGDCVVHDIKLVGQSPKVKHQIDISITVNGTARRVLIECKDFDLRKKPVGLGILRDFRSVLEDTGISEGVVVTCNGYTRGAREYAKSKGIKLAILRQFRQDDMKGRVAHVSIDITVSVNDIESAQLVFDQAGHDAFARALSDVGMRKGSRSGRVAPIVLERGGEHLQYNHFVSKLAQTRQVPDDGHSHTSSIGFDGWSVRVGKNQPIPVLGINLTLRNVTESHPLQIAARQTAELIVKGFENADLIIFGDQLERWKVGAKGEVTTL